MAKSQKRSNREIRKPKAPKHAVAATTGSLLTKAAPPPAPLPKKKKG
jgi:hypothetical protein